MQRREPGIVWLIHMQGLQPVGRQATDMLLRERQRRMNSVALHRGSTDIARIIEQHARLAELIEAGDAAGFATALVEHLSGVHQLELRGR